MLEAPHHQLGLDLIIVSALSERASSTSRSKVLHITEASHPIKERTFAITNCFVLPSLIPCSCSLLSIKFFHLPSSSEILSARLDAAQFMNHLIKPRRSLQLT